MTAVKKRRTKKKAVSQLEETPKSERKSHAGVTVSGGTESAPDAKRPPGMTSDEYEYRMLLQEAILFVTKQILDEQRAEVLRRAEERALTLMELRG